MIIQLPQSSVISKERTTAADHYSSSQFSSDFFHPILISVFYLALHLTITYFCIMKSVELTEDFCLLLYFSLLPGYTAIKERHILQPLDWMNTGCNVQGNGKRRGWYLVPDSCMLSVQVGCNVTHSTSGKFFQTLCSM